mmetsp:Transcript_34958/g.68995  ORF Transcript_34958/g.68995 Transcript_34958/m.68995 type:complete len:85 (+) Transcript_34958:1145-1399(+)
MQAEMGTWVQGTSEKESKEALTVRLQESGKGTGGIPELTIESVRAGGADERRPGRQLRGEYFDRHFSQRGRQTERRRDALEKLM